MQVEAIEKDDLIPLRAEGSSSSTPSATFENNHFTEMCSGSEAGSYLRLIEFVYHSTLGLRVINKRRTLGTCLDDPDLNTRIDPLRFERTILATFQREIDGFVPWTRVST